MPFRPPERAICPVCGGAVYAAEEKLAAGRKFHKLCFKCSMCGKLLESTNLAEHEEKIFCKGCHGRAYGPKGYGFGGGAGALCMDTGEQFGNTEAAMGNVPTQATYGDGAAHEPNKQPTKLGPNACGRCGKTVYAQECAIGAPRKWHKACFRCKVCGKSVDSTTIAVHEEEVYCKNCYGKNFGPKGVGFGGGAGALTCA